MLLGQSSEVAELAAAYNRTTAPALFCLFQYQAAGAELMVQHAGRFGWLVVDAGKLETAQTNYFGLFLFVG